MTVGNALGSGPAIVGLSIAALSWCLLRRERRAAAVIVALAIGTQLIDLLLKFVVDRSRPSPLQAATNLYEGSYPSGHAVNAVAIYGIIALLLAREWPRIRGVVLLVATVICALIGLARVYLRVHWPTDILAGCCIGLHHMILAHPAESAVKIAVCPGASRALSSRTPSPALGRAALRK